MDAQVARDKLFDELDVVCRLALARGLMPMEVARVLIDLGEAIKRREFRLVK